MLILERNMFTTLNYWWCWTLWSKSFTKVITWWENMWFCLNFSTLVEKIIFPNQNMSPTQIRSECMLFTFQTHMFKVLCHWWCSTLWSKSITLVLSYREKTRFWLNFSTLVGKITFSNQNKMPNKCNIFYFIYVANTHVHHVITFKITQALT